MTKVTDAVTTRIVGAILMMTKKEGIVIAVIVLVIAEEEGIVTIAPKEGITTTVRKEAAPVIVNRRLRHELPDPSPEILLREYPLEVSLMMGAVLFLVGVHPMTGADLDCHPTAIGNDPLPFIVVDPSRETPVIGLP